MPTTQTIRNWYPELVFIDRGGTPQCDYTDCPTVRFYATGAFEAVALKVHPATVDAFRALATTFRNYGYPFREPAGGTVNCRTIAGSSRTSLHAHAVALDINPSTNGFKHRAGPLQWGRETDMPKQMIAAIKNIRTSNGKPPFTWGGDWWTSGLIDPMHFQIRVSQSDLAGGIDWSTVKGTPTDEEIEMSLKRGDEGNAVRLFQICMNHQNPANQLEEDGIFGEFTESAVRRYQAAAQITVTGQIDGVTGALLLRYEEET